MKQKELDKLAKHYQSMSIEDLNELTCPRLLYRFLSSEVPGGILMTGTFNLEPTTAAFEQSVREISP